MDAWCRFYREIWAVDFEFSAPSGERPIPLCVVARELYSGRLVRWWLTDNAPRQPPFASRPDALFVAYYASAELGCYLALDWPFPSRIVDLYAEFRCITGGRPVPAGYGLLGALAYFGLDGLAASEKDEMRQLAMRGGPYSEPERLALLDYCQGDVDALARLLPAMASNIDLPRALLRGRYMAAAARMEWTGVPIDAEMLSLLRENWDTIRTRLIREIDQSYGVFLPAGQKPIDPNTRLGAALLDMAANCSVDPYRLAQAVDIVWRDDRLLYADSIAARRQARKATGLTPTAINRWENSGRDSSSWSGLDEQARDLASELPELGIGPGYRDDGRFDDTDYSGALWHLLRDHDERTVPKYDPDILRRATEMADDPEWLSDLPLSFSSMLFERYLERVNIPWPRLDSGALALDDDTFREMARAHPGEIGPLRELRHALSQLKLNDLAVGTDGRNRCLLSAFASRTGRNQPSNSRYIFGPSTWLRSLIKPEPGRAVAYIDWSQQELAIASSLSGDTAMQEAYRSGDFYLTFAKMAGAVPFDATKESHPEIRDQFKTLSLGVLYGLSAAGLARKLNLPTCYGQELLRKHKEVFRQFWNWSDQIEVQGMLGYPLQTVFGWRMYAGPKPNPRSLRNFPMQAHGAEMMRLACCLATERGISVCAPVHDALLVEAPIEDIGSVVEQTQQIMREAGELVLPGFPLRTEAKIVRYPDRYNDPRGERMWDTVTQLIDQACSEVLF